MDGRMDGWMEERSKRWKAAWQSDMSDGGEERGKNRTWRWKKRRKGIEKKVGDGRRREGSLIHGLRAVLGCVPECVYVCVCVCVCVRSSYELHDFPKPPPPSPALAILHS